MRRRDPATPGFGTLLSETWAFGRRYRRLSQRIRKPIAMTVVLAVLMTLTGPTAFAEDPPAEPTTEAPATESPSPEPSPSADPSSASSPDPSVEASPQPTTAPEPSPEPSPNSLLPIGNPTISSDKGDYPPGGAVILTGTNWQPGEIVHVRVNDDAGESWRRDVDVIADGNGTIRDEFQLPEWFVATYTVTATGPISGTASTAFTDSNFRFLSSGPTLTAVSWQLYSNSTCTTAISGSGNSGIGDITTTDANPGTLNVTVGLNQWVGLTAPASAGGQSFVNWVSTSGGAAFTTSGPGNRALCAAGENNNGLRRMTANYAVTNTAPVATIPSFSPASPKTNDSLQASTTTSDVDGDNISVAWTWKITRGVNTCRISTASSASAAAGTRSVSLDLSQSYATSLCTGASPPANINPSKGDMVIAEATPNDGTVNGTLRTNSVAIANTAPTATAQSVTTDEDHAKTIALTGSDNDGDSLSFNATTLPGNGSLYVGIGTAGHEIISSELPYALPSPVVTFDPDANFDGSDSFDFKTNDGTLDSAAATVSIDVTAVNDAPALDLNRAAAGVDTSVTFNEGDPPVQLAPNLTITDVDSANMGGAAANLWGPGMTASPDGASESLDWDATACIGVLPSYDSTTGVLTITGTAAKAVYEGCLASVTYENTSQDPSTVARTVQFVVFDAGSFAASNRPDVALTVASVNDAPVAADDANSIDEDTDIDTDVIANDTDVDNTNGDLTVDGSSISATNGTAVLLADGRTIRFTPDADLNDATVGPAGFTVTYEATDGALNSNQATLTVSVAPVNDAPVCEDVSITTDEDMLGETDPVCSDVDRDALTYSVTAAADGTSGFAGGKITYEPDPNFNGTDAFTYTANDGTVDSNEADVDVTVSEVNDAPVAADDSATVAEDDDVLVDAAADDSTGPANESDQSLTITGVGSPSHGTAVLEAGQIRYTPDPDYNGPDSFTYTITDDGTTAGLADPRSDTATVSVTVSEVNDTPVAVDDSATVAEDDDVLIDAAADDSTGPANESGQSLTITGVGSPSHGTAVLEAGQIRYTPNADYNGPDSFTYTITDDGTTAGLADPRSDTATVSVTVTPVNDAPVIDAATFGAARVGCPTTAGGNNATLTVAFHDVDPGDTHTGSIDWDSNPLTLADNQNMGVVTSPFSASHSYAAPGNYTATVVISDGSLSDSDTESITVNFNVIGDGFKQPVNNTRNGHPLSVFKHGSTIPLKLEVTDCAGNHPSGLEIRIHWQKISGGVPTGELEAAATNQPDIGNLMRKTDSHYMFNWNTKLASDPTATIRIQATIVVTGQVIFTDIGLKK